MGAVEEKITEAELEVMEVLWQAEESLTLGQIRGALPEKNGETVKTLLRRLCAKGAAAQEKGQVYSYHPLVSREEVRGAARVACVDEALAEMALGYDTIVGERGVTLSGGQKQRVAIARALIHDRSILLVDEGTSALDQKNADIVEQSLLNNPNLTLILVSHHLTSKRKAQFTKVFELEPVISTASYNSSTESKESGE